MVDPVSLSVGAVVAALVTKAAEKAGEGAVEAVPGVVGRLVKWLRERFSGDGDAKAVRALDAAAEFGGDRAAQALEAAVDAKAAVDAEFKAAVEKLVEEAGQDGVEMHVNTQAVQKGDNNTQFQDVRSSTITVTHGGGTNQSVPRS